MANHIINVKLVETRVSAVPNPLPERGGNPPEVRTGDTVTWNLPEGRKLQVVFTESIDLDPKNGQPGSDRQPSGPEGPFITSLPLSERQIVGTVRAGVPSDINQARRFLYKILENGKPLDWIGRVEGGDLTNGGGIDTPRTPP